MKSIIAFLFVAISSVLFASDNYVSIGISSQKVKNDSFNKGTALTVNVGKNNIINNLGLEAEASLQLKKPKAVIGGVSSDLKFWSMGMYGTYIWKFSDLTIKPRFGFVYENIKSAFNTKNSNKTTPVDKSKLALSGGIGLSYKLTEKTSLYTNYTKFEDDIEHLTFGAEFKF